MKDFFQNRTIAVPVLLIGYFRIRNTLIRLDPDGAKESLPKFNFLLKFVL